VKNFIEEIIDEHNANGRFAGRVQTRFPPEPNGYLHIGHAKSICLNFGLAEAYGGKCNLRFDDTNPSTEEEEYVESIKEDVRWLGFDWEDRLYFASDYFERFYELAVQLIEQGDAYVDSQTDKQIAELRGSFYEPGRDSPDRDRPAAENLDLFQRMRAGEFDEGAHVLRAKIDMRSPNMNLRDPIMYRIRKASHHRTGDAWCIYPMYDWAHGLEDSIEGITHSICTLEFENHRPLYDWFLEKLGVFRSQQIEFARLNLSYTVMSKRKLLKLVQDGHVSGWDDPRMPTISGFRRRGYTPSAIRRFSQRVGVAKRDNTVDIALLEHTIREELNETAPRVMGVLDPLKVVITNYPEGQLEELDAPLHPERKEAGSRQLTFGRELWIERDDFREDPPRKWHRLAPGREIRLRYACLMKCNEVIKDDAGEVTELRCTWDPDSRGGTSPDGRKVRGTSHWVSAARAVEAEVRLYDRLFDAENPLDAATGGDPVASLNPASLTVKTGCKIEPYLAQNAAPGSSWQLERLGYFCIDSKDSRPDALVFNRTVSLRDTWAKIERQQSKQQKGAKKRSRNKGDRPVAGAANGGGTGQIAIDDFAKLDIRMGVVLQAEPVEGADKLLRLVVDVGGPKPRQVFAGIKAAYPDPEPLVGKTVAVLVNLKPRKMRFGISEGMVLTGGDDDATAGVVTFAGDLRPGDKVT
jgi:glutaminyl-tRNA synthetase